MKEDYDFIHEAWKRLTGVVIGFLLGLAACFLLCTLPGKSNDVRIERDTIVVRDTTTVREPLLKTEKIVKIVKVPVMTSAASESQPDIKRNSIFTDSVEITVTQKIYEDSCYKAWVSGYMAQLDSIEIYNKTLLVTERTHQKKTRLGLQGGVGMTPKGIQPYVGFGLSIVF